MAGTQDNTLSMDMIQLGNFELPEDLEKIEQEEKKINVADDGSQEIVGDSTEESLNEGESGKSTPADSDDGNIYKSLTGFLSEEGLLSVQPDKLETINDADKFVELMREQIKANEYADLNDSQKMYLEAMREGIPEQLFHEHLQATHAFEQLTDDVIQENAEVRKNLIVQGILAQGFDQSYALKHYNRVSGSGVEEEISESKIFRDKMNESRQKEYQNNVKQIEEEKKAQAETVKNQIEELKTSVYAKDKLFDSVPITKGVQDKVYNLMTKAVTVTEDGVSLNALQKYQRENPTQFLVDLYYLFEITEGFKNLKKLESKATSKAINTFKSKLEKSNFIPTSQGNPNFDNNTDDIPVIVDIY